MTPKIETGAMPAKATALPEGDAPIAVTKQPVARPEPKLASSDLISSTAPVAEQGLTLTPDGEASFRVWAPHVAAARLRIEDPPMLVPLSRSGDDHCVRTVKGVVSHGTRYCVELDAFNETLTRRDPYALATEYTSDWCVAQDPAEYVWKTADWKRPEFADYAIYEMHVGSFTPEGTFEAAKAKLAHVKELGFTCVQLMPILEHSDEWGYNPRQFLSLHGGYGSPMEFKSFVDAAHAAGIAVIIDVVLHHAAVKKNALWNFDGWSENNNGGIFHEGAPDTEWGRALAHWKTEVLDMLKASIAMYLKEYRCDGLRFDSANDLPHDLCKALTHHAHEAAELCFLTAEVTPENPHAVHDLGFDNLWVHSAYFDIIHQHRALGRGHHGGGDYADGWDFPRLRTVFGLHYGFTSPTQCTKYILGSHDQVGCKNGGCHYEDYKMIGGQHRYAADQFGGGRDDPWARSATRAWFAANVCAAGVPMLFMGSEWLQPGWWDTVHRQLEWDCAVDEFGAPMIKLVSDGLALRKELVALRLGGTSTLHEDRVNGILAIDRVWEGKRVVFVINAGRNAWQNGEYRVWIGGDGITLRERICTADDKYGGWPDQHGNGGREVPVYDGFACINIPAQSSMIFEVVAA